MDKILKVETRTTDDYSKFKLVNGNRNIKDSHVKGIIKSIKEYGLLYTVIIVNEFMEIIDGQHRFEALKSLGLPITYQVVKGLRLKECIAYNAELSSWSLNDFIESYVNLGLTDYEVLKEYVSRYKYIGVGATASILAGKGKNSGGEVVVPIRNGNFKVEMPSDERLQVFEYLANYEEIAKKIGGRVGVFYTVVATLVRNNIVDKDILLSQISKYNNKISAFSNASTLIAQLEEVYNFGRHIRTYFASDYKALIDKNRLKKTA